MYDRRRFLGVTSGAAISVLGASACRSPLAGSSAGTPIGTSKPVMNNEIDHFMIGSPSLEAGKQFARSILKTDTVFGGAHTDIGTCNELIGCGDDLYLEILCADQTSTAQSPFRTGLEKLTAPKIYTYIVRTNDLETVQSRAEALGLKTLGPRALSRQTPQGETLNWRLLFLVGEGLGALAPIFIDWGDTPNPAATLPPALTLSDFRVRTPEDEWLRRIHEELGVPVPVEHGDENEFVLSMDTAGGLTDLSSTAEDGFF